MQQRIYYIFFIFLFFTLKSSLVSAQQTQIHSKCNVGLEQQVSCDIRFAKPWDAPGAPKKVEIIWPDGETQAPEFKAYNPNEQTTAWLLLFDRSKSLGQESVAVIREDFGKIISGLRSKEKIGIASFAENFELEVPIGADREQLVQVLENLEPVGNQTFLYQSALSALEVLGDYQADRKALVIITDGKSEDSPNVNFQDVISKAQELGVVVYGIGYSEKRENDIFLRDLVEIADKTQGPSQQALLYSDPRLLTPRIMRYFLDFMQNGGQLTFPHRMHDRNVTVKLVATLDNGERLIKQVELPNAFVTKKPKGLFGLDKENELLVILVAAGVMLLLLLFFLIWILRRKPAPKADLMSTALDTNTSEADISDTQMSDISASDSSDDKTQIVTGQTSSAINYGWLEQLDPASQKIELTSTTLSIGRHKDNDIQFLGSTVHRRHATLHMNAEKIFVITDLSGQEGNGIFVNSERIETQELKNGDLIELGDVRMRYIATASN